ncbi:MAG: hypothetical protein CMM84_17765 [Rhodothermaceae bacterium]|nr:hypothetical protein [Rhodothermaceae bacterium]
MSLSSLLRVLCVTALGLGVTLPLAAQPPAVRWSGLAYLDYAYTVSSPSEEIDGTSTFDYRRIYLTADADLGSGFRSRVRLEASDRAQTVQARPTPFMKDAWVEWRYTESGHRATLGLQPQPLTDLQESVWGYRDLDQTVIDRSGYRGFRDIGLRLDGPILADGTVRYAAMVGNGNRERAEAAGARGKIVYGELILDPDGPFVGAVGADYEVNDPADGARTTSLRTSAFAGVVGERFRGGLEAFYVAEETDAVLDTGTGPVGVEAPDGVGGSVHGALVVAPRTSVVARYDYIDRAAGREGAGEHYLLGAVSFRPAPPIRILPNVLVTMPEGTDATMIGRLTVYAQF